MSQKIGSTPPDHSNHGKGPNGPTPPGRKPFPLEKKALSLNEGAATTSFMGMQVTQAQKKKIYANLCNMIMSEMKRDAARQKKAAEALKKSIQGND